MKQHITTDQLSELSGKGRESLLIWARAEVRKTDKKVFEWDLDGLLPLLSIGQMIGFLQEHDSLVEIEILGTKLNAIIWKNLSEPTDVLWEAVKEVLEN